MQRKKNFSLTLKWCSRERPVASARSLLSVPPFIPCYKNLLFRVFSTGAADISCCCRSMKCESREGDGGISKKYIDSDIIGCFGVLKNALLLLIPIFGYIDTDIKSAEWTMISANKFRTIVIFWLDSCSFSLAKLRKVSKIIIDAYGSTGWETMDMSPFPWGWAKGG